MYFYSLIKVIVLTVIKDYKLDIFLFTVSEFIIFYFGKVSESLIFIFLNNIIKYFPFVYANVCMVCTCMLLSMALCKHVADGGQHWGFYSLALYTTF